MATPAKFQNPPIVADPVTGAASMRGAEALPWAIDTLWLGGDLRAKLIRLQGYVREVVLQEKSAKP